MCYEFKMKIEIDHRMQSLLVQHRDQSLDLSLDLRLDLKSASRSPIQLWTMRILTHVTTQTVATTTGHAMDGRRTACQTGRRSDGARVSTWKGRRVGRTKSFGENGMSLRLRRLRQLDGRMTFRVDMGGEVIGGTMTRGMRRRETGGTGGMTGIEMRSVEMGGLGETTEAEEAIETGGTTGLGEEIEMGEMMKP
jgi:hypothetical protein